MDENYKKRIEKLKTERDALLNVLAYIVWKFHGSDMSIAYSKLMEFADEGHSLFYHSDENTDNIVVKVENE